MTLKQEKKKTRQLLDARLSAHGDSDIFSMSYAAGLRLFDLPRFQAAETVMLFLSMPGEIDTSLILLQALQSGKTAVVPRIDWPTRALIPHVIQTLNCRVTVGRHNLREPVDAETVPLSAIDLVVVPGLGFDEAGKRLGRGAGFYDRFLASEGMRATRCGLAFESQVLETLPTAPHDVPMDLLVTERAVRRFR